METTEVSTEVVTEDKKNKIISPWPGLTIFFVFFPWIYYYLVTLRPILNNSLAGSGVKSYPAFLHLIPIFAIPVLCGLIVDFVQRMSKKK